MSAPRTILVPVDFSESTRQSFRAACALAREGETRLVVLNVAEPMYVVPETSYFGAQTARFTVVDRDPAYYEALKERLREVYAPGRPLQVDYHTRVGVAAEEILREADDEGADLIVMGTHGRTGLRRMLAGSVAENVLRRAACPVLAWRGSGEEEAIRTIVHPTDFSDRSEAAARVARTLACELGARLVILHVGPGAIMAEGMLMLPDDPAIYRQSLNELRGRLDGPDLKQPIAVVQREGDPASEILLACDELDCGLIVMGTHGRSGLGRLLMGSVAEGVLRGAMCPVLTVRAELAERSRPSEEPAREAVTS